MQPLPIDVEAAAEIAAAEEGPLSAGFFSLRYAGLYAPWLNSRVQNLDPRSTSNLSTRSIQCFGCLGIR